MPRERNGKRAERGKQKKWVPELGYYYIVTDTEETEKNYLNGLRDSLPEKIRNRLVIKVASAKHTRDMISTCEKADVDPQYRQSWIVFDRDQVQSFDEIIMEAEKKGIRVGWSNPCIEIWFFAYFGKMPTMQGSVECCRDFGELYKKEIGQKYVKSNPQIYKVLKENGDEVKAIHRAQQQFIKCQNDGKLKPSEMCPGTTLHYLIEEIQGKAKK